MRLLQKLGLFRGRRASENGIAMRKTAEAFNDGVMLVCELQIVVKACLAGRIVLGALLGERAKQLHGIFLIVEIFGVFQRQIKEDPLQRRQLLVETLRQTEMAALLRQRIKGECLGCIAIHIARKLIQQQDQRQHALRRVGPVVALVAGGGQQIGFKARFDVLVDGRILAPPQRRLAAGDGGDGGISATAVGAEPECQDGVDIARRTHSASTRIRTSPSATVWPAVILQVLRSSCLPSTLTLPSATMALPAPPLSHSPTSFSNWFSST